VQPVTGDALLTQETQQMFSKKRSHRSFFIALLVVLALLLALAVSACADDKEDKKATPVPTEEAKVTLGLAVSTLQNPFFVSLRDGAQTAADRLGVDLVVKDAGDDAEQQKAQVQELIDAKVSAILINPVDGDAIVPAVEAANAANIPVLTIDRSASGGTIVSHVASDNLAGGRMAAGYLIENLGGSGKVVELEGIAGTSAAEARGAGFNEAVAEAEGIEIIARETANFNREEGKTVFAQILEQHEQIDGVFAHNDEMILGALEAAKEADRAGAIRFVGFDAVEDAVAAVESGDLLATIAQQPAEMGRLGIEAAVDHLNGKTIPASLPVALALITK